MLKTTRRQITEYLDIDLSTERWICNRCGSDLGNARRNYKEGLLIANRDPREVHPPIAENSAYSFAPDAGWCQIVEFYCPQCATLFETEYLPPGHPLTVDIELDIDALKRRHLDGESDERVH
jgi:acetone carboxylase gamma subunit